MLLWEKMVLVLEVSSPAVVASASFLFSVCAFCILYLVGLWLFTVFLMPKQVYSDFLSSHYKMSIPF